MDYSGRLIVLYREGCLYKGGWEGGREGGRDEWVRKRKERLQREGKCNLNM